MSVLLMAALSALAAAPPQPVALSADAPGQILVLAGDRVMVRGQIVRLAGIASPLPAQRCDTGRGHTPCGAEAMRRLGELLGAGHLTCRILGPSPTRWKMTQPAWRGTCSAAGQDLASAMVRAGYATPAPGSIYAAEGLDACMARRGIWAWNLESPWSHAARRDGADVRPLFIGARSGTPCLRALAGRHGH